MTTPSLDQARDEKIRPEHLQRGAYVYVRQSSPHQVEHHVESQRRQYDRASWAEQAGWPPQRITIIDQDQGKTGSIPHSRDGFEQMATAVGRGEVGIVIGLEVARLARNSPDWHHLMYLCRWTETLIADEHGVYDLSTNSDRMVLGLRGQLSELELDSSIHRMVQARWSKARRGEVMTIPPAGYDIDEGSQLTITCDEAVAHAIRTVFAKFEELGTARQVWVWWREQTLQLPVRRIESRCHPVVWVAPSYAIIRSILRHPIYAGAHVFGRSETVREIDPADSRTLRIRRVSRRRSTWPVLIEDHHPAYISFEKYLLNQERLQRNQMMKPDQDDGGHRGAAREGRALLQGVVRCGRCSRPMGVSYGGARGGLASSTMQYRCRGARPVTGDPECQLVGGKRVDQTVVEAFLQACLPAGLDALTQVEASIHHDDQASQRAFELQIEKAEYAAQRAERQYNAVEPENRVVARALEQRWNQRLEELESVQAQAEAARQKLKPLSEAELARARTLASDLESVWHAVTTTNADRKRLLRCLIDEVQLTTEPTQYRIRILWKGGELTERKIVRRRHGGSPTPQDTIELVRELATEFDDAQIARILNKQGRRSGRDLPFTKSSVLSLRGHHKIPACPKMPTPDPRHGPFTADEAARELGISSHTVHQWLREGILAGEQMTPGAPWRIVLSEDVRQRLAGGDAPEGWVGLSEAARQLGMGKSRVAYLVKRGKLPAVRATVGKRTCWRIDVSSTTYAPQSRLFDQTSNDLFEES